jgi:hypothetical protein
MTREGANQSNNFLSFDKDDRLAMDFVTAASNLRATCFHIPTQSRFDIKGNITRLLWYLHAWTWRELESLLMEIWLCRLGSVGQIVELIFYFFFGGFHDFTTQPYNNFRSLVQRLRAILFQPSQPPTRSLLASWSPKRTNCYLTCWTNAVLSTATAIQLASHYCSP